MAIGQTIKSCFSAQQPSNQTTNRVVTIPKLLLIKVSTNFLYAALAKASVHPLPPLPSPRGEKVRSGEKTNPCIDMLQKPRPGKQEEHLIFFSLSSNPTLSVSVFVGLISRRLARSQRSREASWMHGSIYWESFFGSKLPLGGRGRDDVSVIRSVEIWKGLYRLKRLPPRNIKYKPFADLKRNIVWNSHFKLAYLTKNCCRSRGA